MFLNAYPPGLCKKDTDAGQINESKETGSELIIANGDSAELLEFEEELFHKMAFPVKPPIDVPRISFTLPGRDTEIRVMVGNKLAKCPFAIGFISKDSRPFQGNPAEQLFSDSDVMNVAGGQHDLYRVAQSVHNGVNLGASTAATHSDALIDLGFRPDSVWILAEGFYGISGF